MSRAKAKQHGDPADAGQPRRINLRFVLMCAMILVLAGGVVGLSVSLPEKPAPATPTPSATIPPLAGSTGIQNPKPYQYDPVTNRHWDPNHGHWHPGQPPANVASGSSRPNTTLTPGTGPPPVNLPSTGTPNIANPTPWQYDPVTNKHWHPDHGHWHDGQPPAEGNR